MNVLTKKITSFLANQIAILSLSYFYLFYFLPATFLSIPVKRFPLTPEKDFPPIAEKQQRLGANTKKGFHSVPVFVQSTQGCHWQLFARVLRPFHKATFSFQYLTILLGISECRRKRAYKTISKRLKPKP